MTPELEAALHIGAAAFGGARYRQELWIAARGWFRVLSIGAGRERCGGGLPARRRISRGVRWWRERLANKGLVRRAPGGCAYCGL